MKRYAPVDLSAANRLATGHIRFALGREAFFKVLINFSHQIINLALEEVVRAGDFNMINHDALLRRQTLVQFIDISFRNYPVGGPVQQKPG